MTDFPAIKASAESWHGMVYVTIRGDTRSVKRAVKTAEARVDDVARPERAADLRRLTDPASVVRKALGEFERD